LCPELFAAWELREKLPPHVFRGGGEVAGYIEAALKHIGPHLPVVAELYTRECQRGEWGGGLAKATNFLHLVLELGDRKVRMESSPVHVVLEHVPGGVGPPRAGLVLLGHLLHFLEENVLHLVGPVDWRRRCDFDLW
jgi:hypothetical protein